MAARHVRPVTHPKQHRARGSVGVFVHLARRMHHECARHHIHRLRRRAHLAAALEAEIDLGRMRMAVIGTDLARLPARHGDIALPDPAQNLLHVARGAPLLLLAQIEHLHRTDPPLKIASQSLLAVTRRRKRWPTVGSGYYSSQPSFRSSE